MSCSKYTITNNSDRTTAVINYNRCSDNQTITNSTVEPNQTVVIWVVDETFYTVESNTLSITIEPFSGSIPGPCTDVCDPVILYYNSSLNKTSQTIYSWDNNSEYSIDAFYPSGYPLSVPSYSTIAKYRPWITQFFNTGTSVTVQNNGPYVSCPFESYNGLGGNSGLGITNKNYPFPSRPNLKITYGITDAFPFSTLLAADESSKEIVYLQVSPLSAQTPTVMTEIWSFPFTTGAEKVVGQILTFWAFNNNFRIWTMYEMTNGTYRLVRNTFNPPHTEEVVFELPITFNVNGERPIGIFLSPYSEVRIYTNLHKLYLYDPSNPGFLGYIQTSPSPLQSAQGWTPIWLGQPWTCDVPPTPTPSATPTVTPTPTVTTTVTPTVTTSLTSTPTVTPTITDTPTSTPTPTITDTATPTPTITDSPTPTPTITDSPTPTPTITDSPTPTPTVTNTVTPTITNTPSNTASVTPTITITPTITNTPSNTPSVTPTITTTPTNTNTPTRTPTPTPWPIHRLQPCCNPPGPIAYGCVVPPGSAGKTIVGRDANFNFNCYLVGGEDPSLTPNVDFTSIYAEVSQCNNCISEVMGACPTQTPTPTTTPTTTPTPTITVTPSITPSSVYYYYILQVCDESRQILARSSTPYNLGDVVQTENGGPTCYFVFSQTNIINTNDITTQFLNCEECNLSCSTWEYRFTGSYNCGESIVYTDCDGNISSIPAPGGLWPNPSTGEICAQGTPTVGCPTNWTFTKTSLC